MPMTALSRDLASTPILVAFVASLALYDNYLCLAASKEQQIIWEEVKELENLQLLSE